MESEPKFDPDGNMEELHKDIEWIVEEKKTFPDIPEEELNRLMEKHKNDDKRNMDG